MTEIADARTQVLESPLAGLEARQVSAWFGSHKVLERASLLMAPGTVTALIGPSGCGKSTFLRILNRMHEMIPGAALIFGCYYRSATGTGASLGARTLPACDHKDLRLIRREGSKG
jgi:ABC-type polar amino acid transport system ATPase subunit